MSLDVVFVYGTLKRGQRNHRLLAGVAYLGTASTEPRYRLIDCGRYPALLESLAVLPQVEPLPIAGELYRVDAATLATLDRLEDEGVLYRRATIEVVTVDGGACGQTTRTLQALTYFWLGRPDAFPLVPGCSWSEARISPPTPSGRPATDEDD